MYVNFLELNVAPILNTAGRLIMTPLNMFSGQTRRLWRVKGISTCADVVDRILIVWFYRCQ